MDIEMNDGSPDKPYRAPRKLVQTILETDKPIPPPPIQPKLNSTATKYNFEQRYYENYRHYVKATPPPETVKKNAQKQQKKAAKKQGRGSKK